MLKEQQEKESERLRKEILLQSYKRPKKQQTKPEVLHPQDEKKILFSFPQSF